MKKIFMLIICAAFVNIFSACGAEKTITKEAPEMSTSFFSDSVALNSGFNMPRLGLGTWTLDDDTAEDCVYFALKVGYRLIDMRDITVMRSVSAEEFGGRLTTALPSARKFLSRRRLCPAITIPLTPPLTVP